MGRLQAARQNLNGAPTDPPRPAQACLTPPALQSPRRRFPRRSAVRQAQTAYERYPHGATWLRCPKACACRKPLTTTRRPRRDTTKRGKAPAPARSHRACGQVARGPGRSGCLAARSCCGCRTAAEAQVAQAQAALDGLLAGATTTGLARVSSTSPGALNLASARRVLTDTALLAPAAGTVTAVGAIPGISGHASYRHVGRFSQPRLRFWLRKRGWRASAPGMRNHRLRCVTRSHLSRPGHQRGSGARHGGGSPAIQSYTSIDLSSIPSPCCRGCTPRWISWPAGANAYWPRSRRCKNYPRAQAAAARGSMSSW